MQVNLTGHHVEITDALRQYVLGKLERIERHYEQATSVNVILSVEKLQQKAEMTVHVAGNDLHADAVQENLYTAIDLLIDKIDRQIKRHKEKNCDKHRNEKVRDFLDPTPAIAPES